MTGALIPVGANAVVKYEKTRFSDTEVTLFAPVPDKSNIVYAGEDVRKGAIIAVRGEKIDAGTAGALASQGITRILVYRIPRVGILSTGDEITAPESERQPGCIYDANRYLLASALRQAGCEPVYLGLAGDKKEKIAELFCRGLNTCDAILSTGGVSAGTCDITPQAMELSGITVLFRGAAIKPGMACAYGVHEGKLVCGLSGNPASAMTNFYVIALPALKKMCGRRKILPEEIEMSLRGGFRKQSPVTRFLRGKLDLSGAHASLQMSGSQGNAVIQSMIGCDAMAVIPAGSGPIEEGIMLKGFRL